jgi:hypothetical protein
LCQPKEAKLQKDMKPLGEMSFLATAFQAFRKDVLISRYPQKHPPAARLTLKFFLVLMYILID